ncbi:hypothetical protein [Paenibacillus sp. 1P03SA]|uniref:hypothetical protein n=1 Tax=Paenibacillus sp. 1P03SA TaxID=3132294 RepID=UPI0039A075DB
MSRSVKKSPVFKDQQHLSTGWTKRQAGKAAHEWKTFQWLREQLLTHAEVINDWEKFYRRK